MNARWIMLITLLALLGWPALSYASTSPAARVIVASGSVQALGDDGFRALKRRSEIFVGESVMTGPQARAQLRFSDGAIVSLDSNSELLIEAYERDEREPEKSTALLRMVTGGLRSITGAIAEEYPEGYEISTPLASIGVRGTDFQLELSQETLAVAVWDGAVYVSNESGSVDIGPALPFRFAVVTKANPAPEPRLELPAEFNPSEISESSAQNTSELNNTGEDREQGDQEPVEEIDSLTDPATATQISESLPAQQPGATFDARDAPAPTEPAPTDPAPTDPVPTEPAPTPTEPAPTDPAPTEPAPTPTEPVPTDPAPTAPAPTDPVIPSWFLPEQDRSTTMVSARYVTGPQSARNSSIHIEKTTIAPGDDALLTPTTDRTSPDTDSGFIFNNLAPVTSNKVPNFPVYWGSWNGTSEVLFFSNTQPNADGSYNLGDYNVRGNETLGQPLERATWAYSDISALSITDIQTVLPGSTVLTFDSGAGFTSGFVMDSYFTEGALDVTQSRVSFDLDLNTGKVIESSGGFTLAISGPDFTGTWSSTDGAIDVGSDLSGSSPHLRFGYLGTTLKDNLGTTVLESVDVGGTASSGINGFIIPSDIDPSQLGALGTMIVSGRDIDTNIMREGYVVLLLQGQ